MKYFYLVCAILGTLIPWFFFWRFFAAEGLDIPSFIQSLFTNGAAGGFSADVLISMVVFLVWSFTDVRKRNIKRWWAVGQFYCSVIPFVTPILIHQARKPVDKLPINQLFLGPVMLKWGVMRRGGCHEC